MTDPAPKLEQVPMPEEQVVEKYIMIEITGQRQFKITNKGVEVESLPLILRKCALDIERQFLQ
jgi:hypothetical protein